MRTWSGCVAIVSTALAASAPCRPAAAQAAPPVVVGPNLRALPGDHNEPWIAISPTDPRIIIAAAQSGSSAAPGRSVTTLISRDGGRRWAPVALPGAATTPFDPMVATGPNGELYVMHGVIGGDFSAAVGERSTEKPTIRFWSSTDGGWSWSPPTNLEASVQPDHMRMVVDMSSGPRRGRIYVLWNDVADLFVKDQYEVFLQYSDDRGRTFSAPALVATGHDGKLVATEPVVLSDGTLLATWYQYWNPLARAENERMPFLLRRSTDGGRTFGPTEQLFTFGPHIARHRVPEYGRAFSLPIVTADTSARSPHRDHVYITWDDAREGEQAIWFVRSTDRGRSWSAPRKLNDNAGASPLGLPDFRHTPVVAVAPDGKVGVLWYDRRDDPARRCWDLYFTLSTDGGATFSANRKVSTMPSCPPASAGPMALVHNLAPAGRDPNVPPDSLLERQSLVARLGVRTAQVNQQVRDAWEAGVRDGRLRISFGASRNQFAGHYTGLAADRDGDFVALWLDRRTGTQELHVTRLSTRVVTPIAGAPTDVTSLVHVTADTPTWDPATSTVKVRVQLRNVSDRPIGGPVQLRIVGIGEAGGRPTAVLADSAAARGTTPAYSFDGRLGSANRLEPGDISETVTLTLTVSAATGYDAALDFRVMGVVGGR